MANITASQDFYHDVPFTGKLITSHSSFLIGQNDFSELTNFVYTQNGIKTAKGMAQLSSSEKWAICAFISGEISGEKIIAYQTYLNDTYSTTAIEASSLYYVKDLPSTYSNPSSYLRKRVIAWYYLSWAYYNAGNVVLVAPRISSPPDYFLYCAKSGLTGETPPNFDDYNYNDIIEDGTVKWIKYKGNLKGQFTIAPDNTIVFTNGFHNIIYGGDEHRVGAVINSIPFGTSDDIVKNGDFNTNDYWTWGNLWSWDSGIKMAKLNSGSSPGQLSQTLSDLKKYKNYIVTFTIAAVEGSPIYFEITPILGGTSGTPRNNLGTYSEIITAGADAGSIAFSGSVMVESDPAAVHIDDVKVVLAEPSLQYVDITDKVATEDPNLKATLKKTNDGYIELYIGSPLALRGINVYLTQPNTVSSSISVSRWTGSTWETAPSITDGTIGFTRSGKISFDFTEDITAKWPNDKYRYLYTMQLYWYRIRLIGSQTLPDNITLYYLTCDTIPQQIPNLWSGQTFPPASCLKSNQGNYTDHTIQVSKRDSVLTWLSSSSYIPSPETTMRLDGATEIYIGSVVRCMGFRVTFATEYEGKTWANQNACTLNVYYHNGSDWVAVDSISDETSRNGKSFNHDGVVYFTPAGANQERKTTINTDTPLYYYKLQWSSALSANVFVDQIEVIPAIEELSSYISCTSWNGRLVLAGRELLSGSANEVKISAPMSPYIWSGEETITAYVGDAEPIRKVVSLFSRYGNDISETLLLFKDRSLYYLQGTKQDDTKILAVSKSIGAMSPNAVAVCDLGIRITEGVNRSVVLFAGPAGVYLFDNASLITISDDISNIFMDPNYEILRHRVATFYDVRNSRLHLILHDGAKYKEYLFDLIHKKWSQMDRGNSPLIGGATYNGPEEQKLIGFTDKNIVELNTGTTMLGAQYDCHLKSGIKPFANTLLYQANVRRIKAFATFSGTDAGTAQIAIKGYNDNDKEVSDQFIMFLLGENGIKSDLHHLNLIGNTFYFDILVTPNNNSEIELINLTVRGKIIGREG